MRTNRPQPRDPFCRFRQFRHFLLVLRTHLTLAILIAALTCPAYSLAAQSTKEGQILVDTTIASGDEWVVSSNKSLDNFAHLTNSNGATLTVNGDVINDAGIINNNGNIDVNHALNNWSQFINNTAGILNNHGDNEVSYK